MTESDALDFLTRHQPLPSDDLLTDDVIDAYDAVRQFFFEHPNEACVPLFLHSFGEGSGLGVYQLIEDTLQVHDDEVVTSALLTSLRASEPSVRYWSAQIAQNYRDMRLRDPLIELLRDARPGIRAAAIIALWQQGNPKDRAFIRTLSHTETDEEVLDTIDMLEG